MRYHSVLHWRRSPYSPADNSTTGAHTHDLLIRSHKLAEKVLKIVLDTEFVKLSFGRTTIEGKVSIVVGSQNLILPPKCVSRCIMQIQYCALHCSITSIIFLCECVHVLPVCWIYTQVVFQWYSHAFTPTRSCNLLIQSERNLQTMQE